MRGTRFYIQEHWNDVFAEIETPEPQTTQKTGDSDDSARIGPLAKNSSSSSPKNPQVTDNQPATQNEHSPEILPLGWNEWRHLLPETTTRGWRSRVLSVNSAAAGPVFVRRDLPAIHERAMTHQWSGHMRPDMQKMLLKVKVVLDILRSLLGNRDFK
eukprot:CAMPEP_0175839428 /NCGR_PEP_ID=MMETSP0107_2-20121207/18802_1 /TAXON_ID=195067 ORGANISM="Goniomonas pacifica, Strain CCMP1869" /NCGR_SAMPLE_ID=MMETSP0107_2 /ASSEMBLY_ACC=CAM_ASM_000203 /LENGTH=156 /DNA_ID=CAMNT_0017153151 /DNA_START=59 /DNA_END=529 /DNA_ORIENTATION=+